MGSDRHDRRGTLEHRLIARVQGLAELSAAFERFGERGLIGVFEMAADGNAGGDAGEFDAERANELGQVCCSRLSVFVRISGDDHFLRHSIGQSLQ